jgi:pyocin large subunit-like protein
LPGNKAWAAWLLCGLACLAAPGRTAAAGPGFRTPHLLIEHYEKHGAEFGEISQDQYLHLAQQLRDARPGRNLLELQRSGGGFARFDLKHGYFGAYDADGTIRTFFVPNDGVRYFERQARASARNRAP